MFTVFNVASLSLKFTPRKLGIQLVLGILSFTAYKKFGKICETIYIRIQAHLSFVL